MTDTKREIERKYEFPADGGPSGRSGQSDLSDLPDLSGIDGVSALSPQGVVELDAVYYDTADLRLAADQLTLRRRTGGDDAGWHLKFPVSTGIRDEIQAPLADTVPRDLALLLRSRVRNAELLPVVRLRSSRDLGHLVDAEGVPLAEVSVDAVRAERLGEAVVVTTWTEVEVELADGADPALLDAVEKRLRRAGLRPSSSASKLGRALAETSGPVGAGAKRAAGSGRKKGGSEKKSGPVKKGGPGKDAGPGTAGDHVLAYLRTQADAIIAQDPAVRRDLPDSVHQMRVATRRIRSAFRTFRQILDRTVTEPIGEELKWLAAELGIDRDHEVLGARMREQIDALPGTLLLGPVRARLQTWTVSQRAGSRERTLSVLDSARYLALLETIEALLADPPLRKAAAATPDKAMPKAVLKVYDRLAGRVEHALALPPGEERDLALHNARKAAKRARYAAEAARPDLGGPAKRFAKRMKAVQNVLGDHQDSVVARDALRTLAIQAHAAGESAFTWGLLYGQEEARGERRERELPGVWAEASAPRLRAALRG
ncbi:CHAD domain-containing protein [Streptomyces sp. NPDC088116]|uniref:CYTH and CHAD domain-containing protein n=1 Tax=Streptomyces sp. NPDC088116 TaxID=3365825 RepID=UPI00381BE295